MPFQVSPGINVSEINLVTSVPDVATSIGAIAGHFNWGPVGKISLVSSENQLVERYGKPTDRNFETFFSAANFLAYSNRMYVSRAAKTTGVSNNVSTSLFGNTTAVAYSSTANLVAGLGVYGSGIPDGATIVAANNSAISNNFNANSAVSTNGEIAIASNPFISGETVQYLVAAGNTALSGLANGSIYFIRNANATVAYLASAVDGTVITLTKGPTESGHSLTRTNATRLTISANATLGSGATPSLQTENYFDASYSFNAVANSAAVPNRASAIIKNSDHYETATMPAGVEWIAKYPGELGSSLKVSIVDTPTQYTTVLNPYATVGNSTVSTNSTVIPGDAGIIVALGAAVGNVFVSNSATLNAGNTAVIAGALKTQLIVGDYLEVGNTSINKQKLKIKTIGDVATTGGSSYFSVTFETPYALATAFQANTVTRFWEYSTVIGKAPGVSKAVADLGRSVVDQLSVVVIDEDGKFSGTPGTVLETFSNLSRASDAKNSDGSAAYYKVAINDLSRYIWWANDRTGAASNTAALIANSSATTPYTVSMNGGRDGSAESDIAVATLSTAWDLFGDPESVDISLVVAGKPVGINGVQAANYIIDNVIDSRKDCVLFISPERSDVLVTDGSAADNVVGFRNGLRNSSYAVCDSGYKYQYDKYNDVYRYVPLNGDTAGLCARTDSVRDPWFSPAGFNRGAIKNVIKLAWNPSKAERDVLYGADVDPVVTFPGQGTVLFGDKTLLGQGQPFDFINVRRLFIVLEKAIANASNAMLFEQNDDFTRAQFKNLVEPFLRDVQGRRGIYDFRVICDETNNTGDIVDAGKFVGDIYLKPIRSINWIQLNFVGVGSSVEFDEIVGQF